MINNYDESLIKPFFDYMSKKGLNDNGICGFLGNIYAESRLRSNNLQNSYEGKPPYYWTDDSYTKAVDDGSYTEFGTDRHGYGICQWTSAGRKTGLLNYAKSKEVSIKDQTMQIEWLYKELSTSYKNVLKELCSVNNSVESCARIVMCKFERPKNQSENNQLVRVSYAQEFYSKYVKEDDPTFTITESFLTNNDCYKDGWRMTPMGIVVHDTGCNNPYLKRYIQPDDGIIGKNTYNNDWNRPGVNKCVHAMIGKDKNGVVRVYQTLPWNMCCWGCGRGKKGSYNYPSTSKYPNDIPFIQFEILEDNKKDKDYFTKAFTKAIQLCAYLCEKYGLSVQNVVSHHEAYLRGMASNHGDCEDWLSVYGLDMNWFRDEVRALMGGVTYYVVKKGDTLWRISQMFNTTVDELMKLNPDIEDKNKIEEGQRIRVK